MKTSLSLESAILGAALSGLAGLAACGDGSDNNIDPDPITYDAAVQPSPDAEPEGDDYEVTEEDETDQNFAELTTECDQRGGYVQIHAACGGVNSCSGFSVGDWNPDIKSEHTCAGLNGCNGLSCVVLPADSGKTAEQILEEQLPEGGPAPCMNCHAEWTQDGPDPSVFKVYSWPDSGRDLSNWLDLSAGDQARIIAFGAHGMFQGRAYANMMGYHKIYSRAEIERVVEYIRTTASPRLVEIKIQDPE